MKQPVLILLIILPAFVRAQFTPQHYGTADKRQYYSFEGQSQFYSNAIPVNTLRAFYGNPYISNDLKESVDYSKPIAAYNEINAGMQFLLLPDTQKIPAGIFVSAGTRHIRSGYVSPAFYELLMFGNKRFAGKTAVLSDSRMLLCDYQKLGLGITLRLPSDSNISFAAFHIAPVKGQRYMEAETAAASFFTAETGEMVSLSAQAIYYSSDQGFRRNQDFAGTGLASGAMLYVYKPESRLWVYASASDIGFINWKHQSSRTYIDTTLEFSGIYIDNIFSVDSDLLNISSDTLNQIISGFTDTVHFHRSLPETFFMEIGKYFPRYHLGIATSVNYISRAGMPYPRLQVSAYWNRHSLFQPCVSLGIGGSGKPAAGMGLTTTLFPDFNVSILTPDILSLALPRHSYASGLMLRITYAR